MAIPKVNVDVAAAGIIGVQTALMAAINRFGEETVAFFLDVVPERGEKLWKKFRGYQRGAGGDVGFLDFIQSTLMADTIKLFYPKECTLDLMTRGLLTGEIQKGIISCSIKGNADILQIYFGEGNIYEAARRVSCKGCPQTKCKHNLSPYGKRR